MTECALETITPGKAAEQFPHLKVLRLTNTSLHDWSAVDALRAFPKLTDVSLLGIPLLKPYTQILKRQLVIARLPNIVCLNKTKIMAQEREDAERLFIRHYMDEEQQPDRYHELVTIHGILDKLAQVDLTPKTTVTISVHFEDHPPFTQEIDVKQTTASLKRHLGNIVGLAPSNFRLFYRDVGMVKAVGGEEMKRGSVVLYRYHIRDGDEIHIQKKFGVQWNNIEADQIIVRFSSETFICSLHTVEWWSVQWLQLNTLSH